MGTQELTYPGTSLPQTLLIASDFAVIASLQEMLPPLGVLAPPDSRAGWQPADLAEVGALLVCLESLRRPAAQLAELRRLLPFTPIVLLAEPEEEETAVSLTAEFAQEYLTYGDFDARLLRRTIRYASERIRLQTKLSLLKRAAQQLTSTLDLNEVLDAILEQVRLILGVVACSIWLYDFETDELVCRQVTGPGSERVRGWRLQRGQGIVGWVAENGRSVIVSDMQQDARHYRGVDEKTELLIRSTVCIPLQGKQRLLGALQIVDSELNRFQDADRQMLESFAATAAIAIENAQLYEEAQREIAERRRAEQTLWDRNQELGRLYRASDALLASTVPQLGSLANSIVQAIQQEFDQANCSLLLISPDSDLLYRAATAGPYADAVSRSRLTLSGRSIIAEALKTGRLLNIGSVLEHPGYFPGWADARSELVVPLKIDTRVIGAIDLQSPNPNAFDDRDERMLTNFADRAALALQSVRLFDETQRRARELNLLNHIISASKTMTDEPGLFQAISPVIAASFGASLVAIALLDGDGTRWTAHSGLSAGQEMTFYERPLSACEVGPCVSTLDSGTMVVTTELANCAVCPLTQALPADVRVAGQAETMIVPIAVQGQMVAGNLIVHGMPDQQFTPEEVRLGQLVGEEVGRGLERIRLYQQLQAQTAELEVRVNERTDELRVVNAKLMQVMRAKDEFLASMSHELRTPLNAVLLKTEVMQELEPLTPRQARSVQTIRESALHLLDLINDVLDVAKIEAGQMTLDVNPVLVQDICDSSLRLVQPQARKKQIDILVNLDEAAPVIYADGRRLKQILVNLLSNAVKFTPEGGRVGLDVVQFGQIIQFAVWDTGIGIPPDATQRLFEPFVQLDGRLSREFSGTGLGLALVRRLTEMHQGSIQLESEVGRGSCFTVCLPIGAREELPAEPPAPPPLAAEVRADVSLETTSATILLAEDNPIIVDMLDEYLATKGYQVLVARDGLEALGLAQQGAPDLVLMDIQMPKMDGLEVIRHIREDQQLPQMPIVALTALAMPGDQERCLDAGANAYISKPFLIQELMDLIRRQLAGDAALRTAAAISAPVGD